MDILIRSEELKEKNEGKNFKKLLIENVHLTMEEQKESTISNFYNWMNDLEQIDDVCAIGLKI